MNGIQLDFQAILIGVLACVVVGVLIMIALDVTRLKLLQTFKRTEPTEPRPIEHSRTYSVMEIGSRRIKRRMSSGATESTTRNVGTA